MITRHGIYHISVILSNQQKRLFVNMRPEGSMETSLKDRKGRKLSLDEINHYMKVARAIRLTIELQGKLDEIYARID